jgi:hypothetical protein
MWVLLLSDFRFHFNHAITLAKARKKQKLVVTMGFSFRSVCTWLVSILANIIFIGAIGWSSSPLPPFKIWPLSLVVSVTYTVILWFCIYKVHANKRRTRPDDENLSAINDGTADNNNNKDTTNKVERSEDVAKGGELENDEPAHKALAEPPQAAAAAAAAKDSIKTETKISCALSIIYLLAILSLGGPGTVLVLNVLPCFHHHDSSYNHHRNVKGMYDSSHRSWTDSVLRVPNIRTRDELEEVDNVLGENDIDDGQRRGRRSLLEAMEETASDYYYTDNKNSNHHDCDAVMSRRGAIIGGLFLTALPIIIASVHIGATRGIPSSAATLFVGIGLIFLFVSAALDPWKGGMPGLTLWFKFGSAVWILVSLYQLTFNSNVFNKEQLQWGFYAACFFVGTTLK